jgi:shikimate 5-dehydrogenase
MKGSTGEAVLPLQADGLSADTIVFDLVYNPSQTLFLTEAATVGATTVNGLSMLVHQGAASFEIWTGLSGPEDVMMEAAYGALEERR